MEQEPGDVTMLLVQAARGDAQATRQVFQLLYDEFRRAAAQAMQQWDARADHTLQPTALVHEMFLRLDGGELLAHAKNRRHVFGIALRAFEQILIDHARMRAALKRGGDRERLPWDDVLDSLETREHVTITDLHEALEELADLDSDAAEIVRRKYLWNQNHEEIAHDLELEPAAVTRKWRTARAWLLVRLHPDD